MTKNKIELSSELSNLGNGILNDLKGIKPSSANEASTKKTTTTKKNNTKGVRIKRSFMLNEDVVQKLSLLKLISDDDLSGIVEKSIDAYFSKNKRKIEDLLEIYNKFK